MRPLRPHLPDRRVGREAVNSHRIPAIDNWLWLRWRYRAPKFLIFVQSGKRFDLDSARLAPRELPCMMALAKPSKQVGHPEPWPRPAVLPRSSPPTWRAIRA